MKAVRKYIIILIIAAAITVIYNAGFYLLKPLVIDRVLKSLKQEYGVDVRIENLDISLLFSYILAENMEIEYDGTLILKAGIIKVETEYMIMLLFKEINIKQIYIHGLDFSYSDALKELASNLRPDGDAIESKDGFKVFLSSLVVQDSSIRYDSEEFSARISNISLRLFSYLGMYYESTLKCSAMLNYQDYETSYYMDMNLNIGKDFDNLEIIKKEGNIAHDLYPEGYIGGKFDIAKNSLELDLSFPLPAYKALDLKGIFLIEGNLSKNLSSPDFSGFFLSKDLFYRNTPLKLHSGIYKEENRIRIEDFNISCDALSAGLSGVMDLEALSGDGWLGDIDFRLDRVDTKSVLSQLFSHDSFFEQQMFLEGTARFSMLEGRFTPEISSRIDIQRSAQGYSPLECNLLAKYSNGIIELKTAEIAVDNSLISASAVFNTRDSIINGQFSYLINDPEKQHYFIRQLVDREILASDRDSAESFLDFWDNNTVSRGIGEITGFITGNIENPEIDALLLGSKIVFAGTELGNISGHIKYYDERISLSDTMITRNGADITAGGYIDLKTNAPKLLELTLSSRNFPASGILGIYDLDVPAETLITGNIVLDSIKDDIAISFDDIRAHDMSYQNLYVGTGLIYGSFKEDLLRLDRVNIESSQGTADISGSYNFQTGAYELSLKTISFSLFDSEKTADLTGFDNMLLDISLESRGTFELMDLEAGGKITSAYIRGRQIPDLEFSARIEENDGTLLLAMDNAVRIRGSIKDMTGIDIDGDLDFKDAMQWAGYFTENENQEMSLPIRGSLMGSIDLNDLDSIFLQLSLDDMKLNFMKNVYMNRDPVKIAYYGGQLIIKDFVLQRNRDFFRISGIIDPYSGYDLNLQSNMDISLVSQFVPSDIIYTLRGESDIYLDLFGKLSSPVFQGRTKLDNGFVRLRDLSYPVTNINGDFFISGSTIRIDRLSARLNNGSADITGNMAFSAGGIDNIVMEITGSNIGYAIPRVFDSKFSSRLRFTGNSSAGFILSGDVNLEYFKYVEKLELTARLSNMIRGIITGRTTYDTASLHGDDIVRMDIKVTGERNISMDNDLGKVFFKADLDVKGGISRPILLGRAEIISGEIYLLNNTFKELKGTAEFINPFRLDPNINFSGKTFINGYNVTVAVNGSLENPILELASNPSLPEIDILSLLSSGRTTQDFMAGGTQSSLGEYGVSTLLAGNLTSYLEKTAEDLFKFDKVTVTPILSGSQSDLSAKITIEKRLSSRLFLLYSFSTSYGEEQIAILKYQIMNNINAILQRSEFGSIGADIQLGVSFE